MRLGWEDIKFICLINSSSCKRAIVVAPKHTNIKVTNPADLFFNSLSNPIQPPNIEETQSK